MAFGSISVRPFADRKSFQKNSIPFQVIGKMQKGPVRVLGIDPKGRQELKRLPRDEILKIYG